MIFHSFVCGPLPLFAWGRELWDELEMNKLETRYICFWGEKLYIAWTFSSFFFFAKTWFGSETRGKKKVCVCDTSLFCRPGLCRGKRECGTSLLRCLCRKDYRKESDAKSVSEKSVIRVLCVVCVGKIVVKSVLRCMRRKDCRIKRSEDGPGCGGKGPVKFWSIEFQVTICTVLASAQFFRF